MAARVYLDCEFQTFRVLKTQDMLGPVGFTPTPQLYGYRPGDELYNIYHFVLSIGLIVTDGVNKEHYLATFPSLFSETGFTNATILEPGYTVCNPLAEDKIKTLRNKLHVAKFSYFESLNQNERNIFTEINTTYNLSLTDFDFYNNIQTLLFLNNVLIPSCTIVHKGDNDKLALFNTFRYYGIPMNNITSVDLEHKAKQYREFGVGTKLEELKKYFVKKYSLEGDEAAGMAEIKLFIGERYGAGSKDATAHNPLVDCLYTMLIEIGSDREGL